MGKIKVVHVPYRGAAPAITDLLGGQIQALFIDLPVAMPQITGGKLKPIGMASARRSEVLPDVTTVDEQGLPGVHADNWYALFAPARTPAPVIAKLNAGRRRGGAERPGREAQARPIGRDPCARLARGTERALLKSEIARWGKVIRDNGIKPES